MEMHAVGSLPVVLDEVKEDVPDVIQVIFADDNAGGGKMNAAAAQMEMEITDPNALAGLKPLDETIRDGNSRPKEGLPEHKAQKIPNRQGHNQEDTLYKPSCDQCVQKKIRCDGRRPVCSQCAARKRKTTSPCHFSVRKRTGRKPKSAANAIKAEGEVGRFCLLQPKDYSVVDLHHKKCEHAGCSKVFLSVTTDSKKGARFCDQHNTQGELRCEHVGCETQPSFNFEGERSRRFCAQHKIQGMVDVKHKKRCEHAWCTKVAFFNLEGERGGRFCEQHKAMGMVDVRYRCEHAWCSEQPYFNFEGKRGGRFCAQHKLQGMVHLTSKWCEQDGCRKQPCYNVEGKRRGRFCGQHKEQGMVNVQTKRCEHAGCRTMPSFNVKGERMGRFCEQHKEQGMVNVKGKRCEHAGCDKSPTFGSPKGEKGRKGAKFCDQHKEEGMVNVITRKCEHERCAKVPNFNFEGASRGRFCKQHKEEAMVDVVTKGCEQVSCRTVARYNFEGVRGGRYCFKHKLQGMVDVKGKLCERAGCDKRPYYNFEGATPRFCQQHQTEGMINLILARKKKCEHEGCTRVPSFNFHGASKGRFCSQHKEEGMKNIFAACKHAECTKHSSYNFEAGQQPKFCAQHKLQGMVNVKHAAASSEQAQKKEGGMPRRVRRNTRTCEQAGCSKGPTFGFQDEQEGRFCEEHKVNGMVDVKNEVCEHAGCHKAPTFTFKGQWYLRFCARHKLEGMVERAKQDKRQGKRTCKHPGCSTWARGMFCPEHKSKDMGGMKGKQNELVASGQKQAFSDSDSDESMLRKKRRTCEQAGCSAAPLFNFEGEQEGRFCEEHKVNGMVGMKSDEVRSANKARRDLGTVLEGTCPPPPLPPLPPTSSVYEHVGGSSKPASSHVRWASMLVYEEVGLTL